MKKKKETKLKPIKTIKYKNEDTDQIKKFLLLLVGVALIASILYFVTAKYIVKDNFQDNKNKTMEVTFDYTTINVGEVFNRPYEKYYVYAYEREEASAKYYQTILDLYSGSEKVYTLDLSNKLNKNYLSEKGNKDAKTISELAFKNPTLLLIENGKIKEYYDVLEDIKGVLK